jgi:hypothetical protein
MHQNARKEPILDNFSPPLPRFRKGFAKVSLGR